MTVQVTVNYSLMVLTSWCLMVNFVLYSVKFDVEQILIDLN